MKKPENWEGLWNKKVFNESWRYSSLEVTGAKHAASQRMGEGKRRKKISLVQNHANSPFFQASKDFLACSVSSTSQLRKMYRFNDSV